MPSSTKLKDKKECEICGSISDRKCEGCLLTFYCCKEHQELDFESIHKLVCPIIKNIRSNKICCNLNERKKLKKKRLKLFEKLLNIGIKESENYLLKNEHILSIPSSLQALKCGRILFGKESNKLLPILLILSRGCLGSNRIKQTEEFLSITKLIMYKNKCKNNLLLSQFHRLYGRLHALEKIYNNDII